MAFVGSEGMGTGQPVRPTLYSWDTSMTIPLAAFAKDQAVSSIELPSQTFSGTITSIDSGVPPAISKNGSIAQLVTLSSNQVNPTYNGQGVVLHTSPLSGDVVVANQGQSVNGATFFLNSFTRPVAIDNFGTVGFQCSLLDGGGGFAGTGIFRNALIGIDKVAARGDSADGTDPASSFLFVGGNSLSTRDQQWDSSNKPAFYGTTGASNIGANGIWVDTGSGVVDVALSGQASWGLNPGTWSTFESPSINDAGDVAFRACETGGNCISEGIWARIGGLELRIARTGDTAPLPNGDIVLSTESFVDFGMPVINAQGHVAFWASTSPNGAEGIWIADGTGPTGVRRIVLKGDVVRGTGTTIDSPFVDIALADTGQVAFKADLTDMTQALFVESEYHSLVKIARTSEFYDFPSGGGNIKIGIVNFYPGASSQGVGGLHGDPNTATDIAAVAYQLIEDQGSNISAVILTVVGP